tara:strand:- start:1321 stop:2685 length:1365 start_codon:yes stop_codon:yes gene_type:complete
MQIPENIKFLSAFNIAQILHNKKLSPIDLVNYYYSEIEKFSSPNPYTILTKERALAEAKDSHKRLKEDKALSPLDGVPVAWKDLFDFKNITTIGGSKVLEKKNRIASKDAYVVSLAKKAGLIQIGKTSTVELALGGLGTNTNFTTPENTIMKDVPRVPGGSSSGSGVALSNNLCAASFGTDTGGSVRIPAAWNKLIGLKTSIGRISLNGVLELASTYDTVGPLTNSVKDASLLFSILTEQTYFDLEKLNPKNINLISVKGMPWEKCDTKIINTIEAVINKLSIKGIKITEKKIPEIEEMHKLLLEHNGGTTIAEAYNKWKGIVEKHSDLFDKNVLNRMLKGKTINQNSLKIIYDAEELYSKKLNISTSDYDALIMPTIPILPPEINKVTNDERIYNKYNTLALRNTRIANSLRMCAITLPCPSNKPIGIMLCMNKGNDEKLLTLADTIYNIIKE